MNGYLAMWEASINHDDRAPIVREVRRCIAKVRSAELEENDGDTCERVEAIVRRLHTDEDDDVDRFDLLYEAALPEDAPGAWIRAAIDEIQAGR